MLGTYVTWLRCEGKVYVVNSFGEIGDIVALVLILGSTWSSVVSFTSRFPYPGEGIGVWMGPVADPDAVTREQILSFPGIEP
jgi:hypothetical protein